MPKRKDRSFYMTPTDQICAIGDENAARFRGRARPLRPVRDCRIGRTADRVLHSNDAWALNSDCDIGAEIRRGMLIQSTERRLARIRPKTARPQTKIVVFPGSAITRVENRMLSKSIPPP